MVEATITVDGTELPANDVIEAIEDANGPGDVSYGTGTSGNVVVQYDHADDDDAYLIYDGEALSNENWSGERTAMDDVYEAAEAALGEPSWLDDYDKFDTVEYLPDDGSGMWNMIGIIEVNDNHGSMLVNDPVPDAASIEYVNNPAIANEHKEYYGIDVPNEAVVFYMSDERAE